MRGRCVSCGRVMDEGPDLFHHIGGIPDDPSGGYFCEVCTQADWRALLASPVQSGLNFAEVIGGSSLHPRGVSLDEMSYNEQKFLLGED